MPNRTTGPGKFVPRHSETRVREALTDTRIVAIVGPRQSGKTTLARRIAGDDGRPFITLDDETVQAVRRRRSHRLRAEQPGGGHRRDSTCPRTDPLPSSRRSMKTHGPDAI